MYIDIAAAQKSWRDVYRLCIGFINPRPIALVSSVSRAGVANLAPYSFYNMVSSNPPVVIFCPTTRRDGGAKDTLSNVQATGEFVIATATAAIAKAMNKCAAEVPSTRSEFDFCGLTPVPARTVRAPLVAESPVNLECTLRQIVSTGTGPGSGNVVFGDIRALHVADEILDDEGIPDPRKLTTVGRLGGAWYCDVTTPYEMKIPTV